MTASFSPERAGTGSSSSTSPTAGSSSTEHERPALAQRTSTAPSKQEHDGHRWCRCEHCGLERRESALSARGNGRSSLGQAPSRADSTIAKLRSRSTTQFSHRLTREKTSVDFLVDFDGPNDPYHPLNWSRHRKVSTTLLYGFVTMTATWASSSYSAGTAQVAEEFGVGSQVAVLGSSLFLMGFGLGPLLWAPLSEVYGRRLAVLTPMFVAICFSFATAVAKDFQTVIITRFFGAFFASARKPLSVVLHTPRSWFLVRPSIHSRQCLFQPKHASKYPPPQSLHSIPRYKLTPSLAAVTNTGGVLGDMFTAEYRGIAMAGYSMAVVGGPTIGPIVSAAVVQTPYLGWRWAQYITGILQAFVLLLAVIFLDESYPPVLLVWKARTLRQESGNWALHAEFEEWNASFEELARKFLVRPIQLLCTPICFLVALYASFCYGVLYMQLGAIPLIFGEKRGWGLLASELPFLAILLGSVTGAGINVLNQLQYNKAYHAAGDRAVPEKRLLPMMLGSLLFCSGLFITGWTADPAVAPWIAPVIGLYLTGTGYNTIFQSALNYLVDTFHAYAASAVAANTFLRSCFAAVFPLVVTPLYHGLGVAQGQSIFASFACLLVPVPFVFYVLGKRLRAGGKWSKASAMD